MVEGISQFQLAEESHYVVLFAQIFSQFCPFWLMGYGFIFQLSKVGQYLNIECLYRSFWGMMLSIDQLAGRPGVLEIMVIIMHYVGIQAVIEIKNFK